MKTQATTAQRVTGALAWAFILGGPGACLTAWIWTHDARWLATAGVSVVVGFGLGIAWAAVGGAQKRP